MELCSHWLDQTIVVVSPQEPVIERVHDAFAEVVEIQPVTCTNGVLPALPNSAANNPESADEASSDGKPRGEFKFHPQHGFFCSACL